MAMKLVIDGKTVQAKKGMTVLDAAEKAGIRIPTLCHLSGIPNSGSCRLCLVEIEGMRGFPPSCTTPAVDGMKIVV